MSSKSVLVVSKPIDLPIPSHLAMQYGIAPTHSADTLDCLYAHHLLSDNGVDPAITNAREQGSL